MSILFADSNCDLHTTQVKQFGIEYINMPFSLLDGKVEEVRCGITATTREAEKGKLSFREQGPENHKGAKAQGLWEVLEKKPA